eukprot:g836.t1
MGQMRLVVVGAGGRMGRALTRAVTEASGAVVVSAIEREGSELLGQDAGELAGVGNLGVPLTDDPLTAFAKADGVLDFTAPAASLWFAELAAQARIVHVIGTTGWSEGEDEPLKAAARHARIIKSGNMSLGVNLLASLVRQAAAALDADFDIEVLEMHHKHKVDAPSGTALLLGEAAAEGRGIDLAAHSLEENGMDRLLVLVRHGQSEWNLKNLFTGWKDPGLTDQGIAEAHKAGEQLRDLKLSFDLAFTSVLSRAQKTLDIILQELDQTGLETIKDQALNERDYGDLTGMNKDEARQQFGEEQVHIWRRSFDVPPPGGESLKMTAERVLPYYKAEILPKVLAGKRTIVAAHGNSLRSLIMELEGLSPEQILKRELGTGTPIIYRLDENGGVASMQDLAD